MGPGGKVYVISAKHGKIIQSFSIPNESESASTPVYVSDEKDPFIIYGTGTRRKQGALIAQSIISGKIIWRIPTKLKGILSSPLLLPDDNNAHYVFASTMDGEIWKVNAISGEKVWVFEKGPKFEFEQGVAAGYFLNKSTHDIVAIGLKGVWPRYQQSQMLVIDGSTGELYIVTCC